MKAWRNRSSFPLYYLSCYNCVFKILKLEVEVKFNFCLPFISILEELVKRKLFRWSINRNWANETLLNQWKLDMRMHAEPCKRRNGEYSSQGRLDFSDFLFWKLISKHGSYGTVSVGAEKPQCRKTKYNSKVYHNMLLS